LADVWTVLRSVPDTVFVSRLAPATVCGCATQFRGLSFVVDKLLICAGESHSLEKNLPGPAASVKTPLPGAAIISARTIAAA